MERFPHRAFELSARKRSALQMLLRREGMHSPPGQQIPRRNVDDPAPLSFAQERIWFLHQLVPQSPVYNIPAAVRLSGPLDVARLEQSLNEIVKRHEVLRTTFAVGVTGPVQVVAPTFPIRIAEIDVTDRMQAERAAWALRLANEETRRLFDLTRGPLLRATLLRLTDQEHIFLLSFHHIISEVWSIAVLFRELESLYAAFSEGTASPLPDLPIQYADFVVWQRKSLGEDVLEAQLSYWREQLRGNLPVLQLPTDRPRPAVQSFRGAWRSLAIPHSLTAALKTMSQEQGATLFMTLLAAFAALLHRYTGQEDVLVGSPIAGRNRAETETLIGLFINTLVLRLNVSGDPTFRELVQRVRHVALDAYANQDVPFEKLVEELRPERHMTHTPLFQVMFALQNTPLPTLRLAGLRASELLTPSEVHNGTAKTDLALFVEEGEKGLSAAFEYSTDLFDEATIVRMLRQFQTLLQAAVDEPALRISALPLLTATDRDQLLARWNETKTDYPRERCIHELFEAQVERKPQAIAVVSGNLQWTYEELNRRANRLAHSLRVLGVGPEVAVGICAERSPEMVVGILAILKAGGAYVPLDPSYPKERLAFMIQDAGLSVLVSERRLSSALPPRSGRIVYLDSEWEDAQREHDANPQTRAEPENLAYVMYTSGSSGIPKGVGVTHRNVVRLVQRTNFVELSSDEVMLHFAPISFDASTFELWGCLLNGGRLVVFPSSTPSLEELGRVIREQGVTTLWLTAGLFHLMVDHRLRDLEHVRQVLAGGEVLSVAHVRRAVEELRGCRVINGYGPTENTTFTCCYTAADLDRLPASVPVGRPIANTQVYILDRRLQPVPIGVAGELYAGGDGLARGYFHRPELTAEKFIPNPFASEPGARLYKTGDVARYLPDGNIEFLGRNDLQVKIRGFRIELGEIEAAIRRHSAVRESVVIAREDVPGDKRLVAYVALQDGFAPTTDELRCFLNGKLPAYMVPSSLVFLDAFPLTPNGKLDRQALLPPDDVRPRLAADYVVPQTAVECTIAAFWQEVLSLPTVGVHDNFFDLGGHSLLLAQVQARLQSAFDRPISMVDLFRYPTISALARHLSGPASAPSALALSQDRARTRRNLMNQLRIRKSSEHGNG